MTSTDFKPCIEADVHKLTQRHTRDECVTTTETDPNRTDDLSRFTNVEYQVWVARSGDVHFLYCANLTYSVAHNWAAAWNETTPTDALPQDEFVVIKATTTYEVSA